MTNNRICNLLGIQYPIIQGGMVWCSGWKLASAVSNAGGLGLIGAGSMHPNTLEEHILACKGATAFPFGVNIPLMYPGIEEIMQMIERLDVRIVFTSAGNPATWTPWLKERGITVVHVVSSQAFAIKARDAGVDAIVAEGVEAGGHNGRDETTTMVLIPLVREAVDIPLVAAGGISSGRSMLAAIALGADGVQVGSRFAVSVESSAHPDYKERVVQSKEGESVLTLKSVTPVRLLKNAFYEKVRQAEARGAGVDEIRSLLGKGRAKQGIFEGDLDEGELEIGQVAAHIRKILPVQEIMDEMISGYRLAKQDLARDTF
jgi:enoyl-[acyl-carrier protein] reductase II